MGLIFAELGKSAGIFNEDVYTALVIVIALSTVLPIFTIKWFYTKFNQQLTTEN